MKGISQERDELVNKIESFDNQLKAAAEEKAVIDRELSDTKEEFQSVKNQLLELKENLQIELKEKEVSVVNTSEVDTLFDVIYVSYASCHVTSSTDCHVRPYHFMSPVSRHVFLYHVMSRHVTPCHVTSRHIMPCLVITSYHVMPCHHKSRYAFVISRLVTSCRVLLRHVLFA